MDEATRHHKRATRLSGAPDTWPLSALDAARIAGVSERTIRRAIVRGELPATKHAGVYRISPGDLADYRARAGSGTSFRQSPAPIQTGLPRPPASLIGRENERAATRRLLYEEGAMLVTLTGPGGVGKTLLALHVAAEMAESFDDGAFFVDLSPVRDPARVLLRIAQSIGVRDVGRRDIATTVATYLRPRQILLILDNCEQVLDAAPFIATLLAACPALQILATSRAPLRLRGEYRLPVSPFSVPSPDSSTARLVQSDAIRLFLDRAHAVHPAFAPTSDDLQVIAGICQKLDGLPLAIELASARSALLPPRALLEQLSDRLRLLTGGSRDLPDRQRTMRDAISWSYELLAPAEQALFRSLAVFFGGFDLAAAIAISDANPADVLGQIGTLVEQSLLRRLEDAGNDARFVFLETVREYAWMQLKQHGEVDVTRGLHAEYFLNLAEHIETVLYGSEMRHYLDRLETEHPNCRAALRYFVEIGDAIRELRLAGMLSEYWYYRGQISEGVAALRDALARGEAAPPGPRARAMSELGFLLWATGATQQSLPLLAASVPLARQAGNTYRLAQVQYMWADVLQYEEGREAEAIALLDDVVELITDHQPPLELYPSVLVDLGELWLRKGDRERGVALLNQALTLSRDSADPLHIGQAHLRLGRAARQDSAARRAADHYGQSLRAYRDSGIVTHAGVPLAELGGLVAASGYPEAAIRIAGMIQSISDRTGAAFDGGWAFTPPYGDRTMSPPDVTAVFGTGRALPFAMALSEAIAIADAIAAGTPLPGKAGMRPAHTPVPLSARERDVLVLLAKRYTAPEMADHLFLSVRTVEHHVANIYNKLGVNSRRAAAAAAARHGLV